MEKDLNLEKLKTVKFRFAKDAFRAKIMHCSECGRKTSRKTVEMKLPDGFLTVKLNVLWCAKCKKEYLSFDEAKKLDRALLISRAFKPDSYKIKKSLSFDGGNYIFRIPAGLARNMGKKPHADMVPLSSRDLLVHLETG